MKYIAKTLFFSSVLFSNLIHAAEIGENENESKEEELKKKENLALEITLPDGKKISYGKDILNKRLQVLDKAIESKDDVAHVDLSTIVEANGTVRQSCIYSKGDSSIKDGISLPLNKDAHRCRSHFYTNYLYFYKSKFSCDVYRSGDVSFSFALQNLSYWSKAQFSVRLNLYQGHDKHSPVHCKLYSKDFVEGEFLSIKARETKTFEFNAKIQKHDPTRFSLIRSASMSVDSNTIKWC